MPLRATARGAAPAPRGPRARAGARSQRTLAIRAALRPPPRRRPQSATEASCGVYLHPSSPAPSSPLRRRVRRGVRTALATRAYRERYRRARCASSWRYVEQGREARYRGTRAQRGNALGHCLDALAEALKPRALSLLRAHAARVLRRLRAGGGADRGVGGRHRQTMPAPGHEAIGQLTPELG